MAIRTQIFYCDVAFVLHVEFSAVVAGETAATLQDTVRLLAAQPIILFAVADTANFEFNK